MIASLFVTFAFALLSLAAPATETLERRQRAQVINRCSTPNTAALTFDDGPYIYMKDIVDLLDQNDAKGTFFYNGNNYRCIYDQDMVDNVKYAYNHGHQVASHTWGHRHLASLTWDQIHDEMWRVEPSSLLDFRSSKNNETRTVALSRITGAYPAFFRPPYGEYNNLVLDAAGIRGQAAVIWDLDSGDSAGASVASQKSEYDDVVNRHPSTILSLQHEVYETTAHQVVEYAINKLQNAGYRLVTVAECLGEDPYQSVAAPQSRTADWHC